MKLLCVTVCILAIFFADCWAARDEPDLHHVSDGPQPLPGAISGPQPFPGASLLRPIHVTIVPQPFPVFSGAIVPQPLPGAINRPDVGYNPFAGRHEIQDSAEEDQQPMERNWILDDEVEVAPTLGRKGKNSSCKAKTTCVILGGSCVTNATLCSGRLVPSGCKGTNCQCCVPSTLEAHLENLEEELQSFKTVLNTSSTNLQSDLQSMNNNMNKINSSLHSELRSLGVNQECPISKGYFIAPGSNQCLGVFLDKLRTWPEAAAKCKEAGLVLMTKPTNAVALHKYLIDKYYASIGNQWYWVNAKGDGSTQKWQLHKDALGISKISNSDSLYVPSPSGSTSYCLQIATYPDYLKSKPGKVYSTQSCTGDKEYALCEKFLE